jgi:putative methionine-R-sulfoxide reductase with GAF domain
METSFTEIMNSNQSREEKLKRAAEKIRKAKGYSWVGIYEVGDKEITNLAWAGRSEPVIHSFPKDKGLNGRAVTKRQSVIVNDIDKDEDYLLTFTDTQSEIVSPIFDVGERQIVGTIDVESETENAFTNEDIIFLEDCARQISQLWKKDN